jgi:hypothetical protein
MKKYLFGLAAVSALLLTANLSVAATTLAIAKVPFEFTAGENKLPAGQYEIQEEGPSSNVLIFRNVDTGKSTLAEYLTRLSQRQGDETTVVLDKIGDQYALTEIHPVGSDGYYLTGLKGKHTHVSIKSPKAAKKN